MCALVTGVETCALPICKPALAALQLDDAGDVGADLGTGEDLARGEANFRRDLVVLEPLIALQDDAVDDRVLADLDRERALVVADLDVSEQFGRVKVA